MATHRPHSPITLDSAGNETSSDPSAKAGGMSSQQRTMIAVGGLVLCLLIGGGIVYWFLFGAAPKRRTITVDPQQQTPDVVRGGQPMFRPAQRPPQLIVKEDDKSWIARGASGGMRATQDGAAWKFDLYYPGRDFLTPDQVALVAGFVRARRDEAMAKEWGITPEQLIKLKAIELGGSAISISNNERTELRNSWDEYMKSADGQPKLDAEKKVIARLDELGRNNLESSRKAFAQRLEQIKQVLTPPQLAKIAAR